MNKNMTYDLRLAICVSHSPRAETYYEFDDRPICMTPDTNPA